MKPTSVVSFTLLLGSLIAAVETLHVYSCSLKENTAFIHWWKVIGMMQRTKNFIFLKMKSEVLLEVMTQTFMLPRESF